MTKSYCSFIDEITSDDLYEGLLGYGLFPDKLPPVFSSVSFLDYCKNNHQSFTDNEWHDYISFSSMRNINIPRQFGIPTPMKYEHLCSILHDNWDEIKAHFHKQTDNETYRISRIHLRKMAGTLSLFEMNYKNWHVDGNPETDLLFLTHNGCMASKFVVKADISTCFPSIYTHTLPWALVGKDIAKANCKDKSLWYNKLDSACSCMKNGETHGLLIGPHSSNLLSEIILTCIDKKLYDAGYRYYRNIDDYECYVETHEKAQLFLRDLEEALMEFDLPLNHKKTLVQPLPVSITENWIHKLNGACHTSKNEFTYTETNSYLDIALNIANENGDSSVLKYAIKSLSGQKLTENAKYFGSQRIMHFAALYPYLLQLMEEYVFKPFEVSKERIKVFADTVYSEAKAINNYEAICFAIYFSMIHDFKLADLDIDWVIERKDCVLLLMTWLYYLKTNHGKRNATQLKPLRIEAMRLKNLDMDRYWLYCFEVLSYNDLSGNWSKLKQAGVSFVKEF